MQIYHKTKSKIITNNNNILLNNINKYQYLLNIIIIINKAKTLIEANNKLIFHKINKMCPIYFNFI